MNWPNLITEIITSGMTQQQIAKAVGCGQTTLSELQRGVTREPRASLGFALLRLGRTRGLAVPNPLDDDTAAGAAAASATHRLAA